LAGQRPQLDRSPRVGEGFAGMKSRWSASTLRKLTRIALVLAAAAAAFHVVDYVMDRRDVLARVPEPLEVETIEYRLEQAWGLGFMPGDNETGFVVYRLTAPSAAWATAQGQDLRGQLPGGAQKWRPTPVDETEVGAWHHYDDEPVMMTETRPETHRTTISEFLERYGFTIPIEQGRDAEANHAITSVGSFYALGRGGSVTIVDPARGKVYFAYAG